MLSSEITHNEERNKMLAEIDDIEYRRKILKEAIYFADTYKKFGHALK